MDSRRGNSYCLMKAATNMKVFTGHFRLTTNPARPPSGNWSAVWRMHGGDCSVLIAWKLLFWRSVPKARNRRMTPLAAIFLDPKESAKLRLFQRYLGAAERAWNKADADFRAARRERLREQQAKDARRVE